MRKNPAGWSAYLRRACAFALIFLLSLQLLPGVSLAADEDSAAWKTLDNRENHASFGKAVTNTYIMEVSSGTRQGGGAADNVLYFVINYTSDDGQHRTAVLAPHEEAISQGFEMAEEQGSRESRRKQVSDVFGYSTAPLESKPGLGSLATDQYMFTTPSAITSIDKIQVFGKRNEQHGNWSCQGMRIYRVDTLYGLEMYGWYSDTGYIDFDGALICKVEMPSGGVTFRWTATARLYNLTADTLNARVTNISEEYKSQLSNRLVFRIDFADVAGAGFETLAGSYTAASKTRISDLKFCETAAIIVRYTDTYGCVREITLPLVINALGQIMEIMGDEYIAEYAQQGDTIAVPAMLPDFANLESVSLVIGEKEATEAAHLITGAMETKGSTNIPALNNIIRSGRVQKSESDDISYVCFAVYRDVTVQAGLEGATLRTRFTGGTPLKLATATSQDGVPMQATKTAAILLRNYETNIPLAPKDRTERYLITMSTDNVPNAGTSDDIYLKFSYISVKDKELESSEYRVRDYVREFYGQWPGSEDDFAYSYGLRDGGTIRFMIPLQNVKEFKTASVRLSGEDEWQFTGIEIAMVKAQDPETGEKAYSPRMADWREIAVTGLNNHPDGLYSHLTYSRIVETEEVCFSLGTVYEDEEERPDPNDPEEEWEPGTLIQDDDTYSFDGETQEVTTKDDVPWDELRHYMTYNDALKDLGFTKERCSYTVTVQVAGKTVNPGNDDCGSKNLFYFRLVFEHGNSGCTLANQQIVGDAFGTGEQVQFKIPTSQDYGEVLEVQVIPDAQDSNSDIYDKLQIEWISVTKDTTSAVSPTWTAKVATGEDEGWVSINYRDPGEYGGTAKVEGYSLSELATSFPITETSYSTNLLVTITTADYETGVPFTGGMRMDLNFINAEGRTDPKPISGFDVVGAMNEYSGLTGSHTRRYKTDGETVTENADYYVSDSRYQFRPSSTDSFLVTIKNVYQLTDMTLTVYSDEATHWTIKDVSVYQLNGQGIRYLNAAGSYAYRYKIGEEPSLVARWEQDYLTTPLAVYDAKQNSSMAPISFALNSETIKLSADAAKWSSKITAVPSSHNDTLNLILYPGEGSGAAAPEDYEVTAAVKYTDAMTMQTLQVSAGQLKRGTDSSGRTIFYASGISANNQKSIDSVEWSATILRTAQPSIISGVLQVIRGGVLVESYPLVGAGYSLHPSVGTTAVSTQRLMLQVSEDTKRQTVTAKENDLAVALYFRSDDPGAQEYRSKYVFLSDMGIGEVRPGQLLELEYNLGNVSDIMGINVVSMGKFSANINCAYLADQSPDGTISADRCMRSGFTPNVTPSRYAFEGDAQLLTLAIETAEDEASSTSGTNGPIRMSLGYYDLYGQLLTRNFSDIRPYVVTGQKFASGSQDTVRMLVPDMAELRWIELEPVSVKADGSVDAETMASWKVRQVSAYVGLEERGITRTVNQRVLEGEPLHVGFSDIVLLGTVYVAQDGGDLSEPVTSVSAGRSEAITVDSGADVFITVRLSGSDQGFTAKLDGLDAVTGEVERALLDPTHGYTDETLDLLYERAGESAEKAFYELERTNAERVMELVQAVRNTGGRFYSDQIRLTTPHNYTGNRMKYRITVRSEEEPDAWFTLDVTVRSEPDELAAAIEAWNGVLTAGTVYVRGDGVPEERFAILEDQSLSQLLESGGSITIVPHVGMSENAFGAAIREFDPVTNATGAARLGATHGYTEAELSRLVEEARESLSVNIATEAERDAAREVIRAINDISGTEGSFEVTEGEVRFTAPRNYTGEVLYYRITVNDARTGEDLFTVDASVKAESDPLTAAVAAWRAAQTAGTVSVLNERNRPTDTVRVMKGETHAQMLASGQGVLITPRASGYFEASVKSLDPMTGATGTANLDANTGYTTDELYTLRTEARSAMSDRNATDAEIRAAEAVVSAIDAIRNTDGDYEIADDEIDFRAPHNYSGAALYYRITVTDSRTGELLFTVDLSVEPEENPLISAVENWRAVQTAGTVRVLDSDGDAIQTYSLAADENRAQRLESGGGLVIMPRASGSFYAEITSLDPSIGATSAADLSCAHSYSSKELQWMEELAREVVSDDSDDASVRAARYLLSVIDAVEDSDGSFRATDEQIRFTAPRNISGSTIYYRITVYSDDTGETLFTLDISVTSEHDPIKDAFDSLNDALSNVKTEDVPDDSGSGEEEGEG